VPLTLAEPDATRLHQLSMAQSSDGRTAGMRRAQTKLFVLSA
jgi:hypothetical protein